MNEKIISLLQSTIDDVIKKFQNSQSTKSYFFDWQRKNQSNPNFTSILNISLTQNQEEIQFCLESLLALSMKISLIDNQQKKNSNLEKLQKAGSEKISKMIFEKDFYSWIIEEDDKKINESIIGLSDYLSSYTHFNDIYECLFEGTGRKSKGQFFTERDLADFIIQTADFKPNENQLNYLLDPASGAASFIVALLDLFGKDNRVSIFGIDKSYFACIMSRIAYLKKYFELRNEYLDFLPIFWMDFLIDFDRGSFIETSQSNKIIGPYSSFENQGRDYLLKVKQVELSLIVGNPPYQRIQNLDKKLRGVYSKKFGSAVGRFDIFFLFIEHSINQLKKDGKVAYICSNKFMTTEAGRGIRNFLVNNAQIEKLIDLTDTEMFTAMVLPCIIVLSKNKNKQQLQCINLSKTKIEAKKKIKREELWKFLLNQKSLDKTILQVTDHYNQTISVEFFNCPQPHNSDVWHFLPLNVDKACEKIKKVSEVSLSDIADIRVGIKTTCDKAFVIDKNKTPFKQKESSQLIFPLLTGKELEKWFVPEPSSCIIYPYERREDNIYPISLDEYPEIKNYFEKNRETLENRDYLIEAGREWFEIWVPQSPQVFEAHRKIVTPDISPNNRFSIDTNGYYCQGTCFMIHLHQTDLDNYCYILGLLNSKLMEFYHKSKISTNIYAKRYRYWASYLSQYPIITYRRSKNDRQLCESIIQIVKSILNNPKNTVEKEDKLNQLVYELYQLSKNEIQLIEDSAKIL